MNYTHDVIVIGAGAAGLTVAGGCAMAGLKVALIERGKFGGDCLNTGCVPSKTLISIARRAEAVRMSYRYGLSQAVAQPDFAAINQRIHAVIAKIGVEDDPERFRAMGVEVLHGNAHFLSAKIVGVNGQRLSAPRIVIASGSKPYVPPLAGIESARYLTSDTIWGLKTRPSSLLIVGAGPMAVEMASAYAQLAVPVTLLHRRRLLPEMDEEAARMVHDSLCEMGVKMAKGEPNRIRSSDALATIVLSDGREVTAEHLLFATGRIFHFADLELEKAGIAYNSNGIEVDARRRTNVRGIHAIGDCRPGPHSTHVSGYEGALMVKEIAFGLPSPVDWRALPRTAYCTPEVAQVGLTEAEARSRLGKEIEVIRVPMHDNNRAVCELSDAGFAKLVRHAGKFVGATIVGDGAADAAVPLIMALSGARGPAQLASLMLPYPTRSEIAKTALFAANEKKFFNPLTRRYARALARLRRMF